MTDTPQFLETEDAVHELLVELQSLKSAAAQVSAAGAAAEQITSTSEQVVNSATGVLRNSARLLASFESARIDDRLRLFQQQLEHQGKNASSNHKEVLGFIAQLAETLDASSEKLDALRTLLEAIQTQAEEMSKQAAIFASDLERTQKLVRTNRGLLIAALVLILITLVLVASPYLRPLLAR